MAGMTAVDCCHNLEAGNHEDSQYPMDVECEAQHQEDSSPALEVDSQVQPELGSAAYGSIIGIQHATMQLE